jgi:hypothetical protein
MTDTPCPSPHKIRHRSRGAAWTALDSLRRSRQGLVSPDLLPYRCVCGAWHIGHDVDALAQRIRTALPNVGKRRRRR